MSSTISSAINTVQATFTAMTLPKTYTAMTIKEKGKFEKTEVELKQPQDGQVLVKVLACGVCHSDDIAFEAKMPILPRVPGHEVIGDVVAVPSSEKRFKVGDRVGGGWHGGHCGVCARCRRGDFGTCENEAINGITMDGGYAEYVLLRTEAVVSVPEDMDPAEAAPLLCAGVTVYNSIRNMQPQGGDLVAIQGIGGLGHLALQYASKMGLNVAALSSSDKKKDMATRFGANEYIVAGGANGSQAEQLTKLGGAKLIVCTAPSSEVIKELVQGLAVNGTLLILAIADDLTVPCMPLIQKRLTVRGWPSGTAYDSEDTLKFAQQTGVKCEIERYSLEDVSEAYESMIEGKARFRAVLVPGLKK